MDKVKIKSERLVIRTYIREDIEHLFPLIKDNWELTKYMMWDSPSEIEESYVQFDARYGQPHDCLFELDGNIIGRVSIRDIDIEQKSANFGYWIHQNFQGKGFGTELLETLVKYCETELGIEKIVAETFTDNVASQKLLEKVGFVRTEFRKNV
jgi:ribosomal-protein-alanine N-acetyltransferase